MNSDDNIFTDNGDGTVVSKSHKLMWCKNDSMIDLKKWVNYQDSVDYVRGLNENKYAGYDDWRLPSRDEMLTLFDKSFENKDQFGKTIHMTHATFARINATYGKTCRLTFKDAIAKCKASNASAADPMHGNLVMGMQKVNAKELII